MRPTPHCFDLDVPNGPMAMMHFDVPYVSRARGSNAVARAAYIARDRIHSESRHQHFDYRARGGLEHSEIVLPDGVAGSAGWARDRTQLWNAAERVEVPANARTAREYIIALPYEMEPTARLRLAQSFAHSLADRYGAAIDVAIHRPPPDGDPRNHHVHMLSTTREVSAGGLGRKTIAELSNTDRRARGLSSGPAEILFLRHWWAERANEHLRDAGIEARVDPRSLWERGEARAPRIMLTRQMVYMEKSGRKCEAADRLRELHAARQELMERLGREHAQSRTNERAAAPELGPESPNAAPPDHERSLAERERQAIDRWLDFKRDHAARTERGVEREPARDREHGAEFDL